MSDWFFPVQTYLKSAHAENETSPNLLFSLVFCQALSVLKDRTVGTLPAFNYVNRTSTPPFW